MHPMSPRLAVGIHMISSNNSMLQCGNRPVRRACAGALMRPNRADQSGAGTSNTRCACSSLAVGARRASEKRFSSL
jgi:hypothetical protein